MTDRAPARRAAPRAAAPASRPQRSAFVRGAAGRERTDSEIQKGKDRAEQRKAQANKPFRFYVPVGETRQFIVCDDKPDFFLYEHALKNDEGKWGRLFCGCIKEFANCPVCRTAERESYYALALTIVDLTPFETKDGDTVDFSRKLLIVKPAQQKKFLRFYEREGSLRGAVFETTRDGDKDATIGNDINHLEWAEEDEMETYVREWKDREGKKHTEICSEVYVYETVFDEPTEESLQAIAGGDPVPGSRAANSRELGSSRGRRGAAAEEPAERGSSRVVRRSRPAAEDGWEDDKEDRKFGRGRATAADDAGDEPPARPARRGRAEEPEEPPARPVRGRARAEPEDEPEPAPRRGRRAEPEDEPEPAPRRGRRADPEPEPEDEPAPRRGRAAAADPDDEAPPPRRGRAVQPPDDEPEPPRRGRRADPEPEPEPRRGRAAAPTRRGGIVDEDVPF